MVQAIGGALAATAGYDNFSLLQHGNRAIIAGITLQVVVLLFFGLAAADYYVRVRRWVDGGSAGPETLGVWRHKKFRMFVYAVSAAYGGILIRCIYRLVRRDLNVERLTFGRIAEMAGGWGNHIMRDEPSYVVLEGL